MDNPVMYPKHCRRNIRRITEATGASVETAYAMMLMTALLMDLHPEDEDVLQMILKDCGVDGDA